MQHTNIANYEEGKLSFFLPRPLLTEDFRRECSLWFYRDERLKGYEPYELRSIFHHGPENKPNQGLSPYRFDAQAHWGHIYGLGTNCCKLLERVSRDLAATPFPTPWLGTPQWSLKKAAIKLEQSPVAHWIPNAVICKNAEQHHRWKAATPAQQNDHVRDLIKKGLERQLRMLGAAVDGLPTPEIKMITHQRALPRLKNMDANAFVRVACIGFSIPLTLDGHWVAGGLSNRGYGRILPLAT